MVQAREVDPSGKPNPPHRGASAVSMKAGVRAPAFCFFTERAKPDTRLAGIAAKVSRYAPFLKMWMDLLREIAKGPVV
jgi:hypothetical protein